MQSLQYAQTLGKFSMETGIYLYLSVGGPGLHQ